MRTVKSEAERISGFHAPRQDDESRAQAANEKALLAWAYLDYRHTSGSQLAMKGESLYKISKVMGNSPEICRRHYAALVSEAMVDSVEFLEKAKTTVRHAS